MVELGDCDSRCFDARWYVRRFASLSLSLSISEDASLTLLLFSPAPAMALATQSILLISCSITYQIPFSLSIATAVRSGNLLGAGRGWEAKWTAWVALGLSIVISVFNRFVELSTSSSFRILDTDILIFSRSAQSSSSFVNGGRCSSTKTRKFE